MRSANEGMRTDEEVEVHRRADCVRLAPGRERDAPRPMSLGSPGSAAATFYIWRKKYAYLGVSELRELRSLEDEKARPEASRRRPHAGQAHARGGVEKKGLSDAAP
jgi:hypothetical protein